MPESNVLAAARRYLSIGWLPVPVKLREKRPTLPGWQKLRLTDAELPEHFTDPCNVGLLLGDPSGGLVDVDLDCPEARELAGQFLPATDAITGRESAPGAHWWYICPNAGATRRWNDPDSGEVVVEVRGTGGQTVVGPSIHPSGEEYGSIETVPTTVDAATLTAAVEALHAAVLERRGCTMAPAEPTPATVIKQSLTTATPQDVAIERRAVAYLNALPPGISGQGGHNATYAAATALVHGFALSPGDALSLLMQCFNPRCVPQWTETELRHKIRDAAEKPHDRPYGWLRDTERPASRWMPQDAPSVESEPPEASTEAVAVEVEAPSESDPEPEPPNNAVDPGLLQVELLRCPGFVSELMDHTMATAPRPNQALAFCGALALMAFLGGRKVCDKSNIRTNLYLLALAQSGVGKDHPRKVNKAILRQIGMTTSQLDQLVSSAGLEDALVRSPVILAQTDEIDAMLQAMNKERSGFQYELLVRLLLNVFTCSNDTLIGRPLAKSEFVEVDQPCLVLFGTAIPQHYYAALSERMLTNGFFARMLIFEAGERADRWDPKTLDLPPRLIEVAKSWANRKAGDGNLADMHPTPAVVDYTDSASAALREAGNAADAEYKAAEKAQDQCGCAVWNRAEEMVRKLSLLYAISERHDTPKVDAPAVQWAAQIVNRQISRSLYMAERHVTSNEFEATVGRMRIVLEAWHKRHGDIGMPGSYLHRRFKNLSKRALEEAIEKLQQMGFVALVANGNQGRQGWKVHLL